MKLAFGTGNLREAKGLADSILEAFPGDIEGRFFARDCTSLKRTMKKRATC
jgi:hypothetical protein